MTSKTSAVLELMERQWVSPILSLERCHLHALSQQVTKLKARGVPIETRMVNGHAEYRVKPGWVRPAKPARQESQTA